MAHPYAHQAKVSRKHKMSAYRFADGGAASKIPQGDVKAVPLIKNQRHLDRLVQNANSDDALKRLKDRMEKQGLSTDFDTFR